MTPAADGLPTCGASRRVLGVLIPGDVKSDQAGLVQPGTGGMSVAPDRIRNLPQHRRPTVHGGTGKDPVFVLRSDLLGNGLRYRADAGQARHGLIEPTRPTRVSNLQSMLCMTRSEWTPA